MAKRNFKIEKKTPKPFSLENSIWDRFKLACYNIQTTPSAVLQKFIHNFLKKHEKQKN